MARGTPNIVGETLSFVDAHGVGQHIVVGSSEWSEWLRTARSFAFEENGQRITAQLRTRGLRRYWYAYIRAGNLVKAAYLGRDGQVGIEQLRSAMGRLIAVRIRVNGPIEALGEESGELLSRAEARLERGQPLGLGESRRLVILGRNLLEQARLAQEQADAATLEMSRLRWELQRASPEARDPRGRQGEVF